MNDATAGVLIILILCLFFGFIVWLLMKYGECDNLGDRVDRVWWDKPDYTWVSSTVKVRPDCLNCKHSWNNKWCKLSGDSIDDLEGECSDFEQKKIKKNTN